MVQNKNERGFTLVELSIVLVIAGLIVGGVLTGQQVIQNARISNAANAFQAYQAQIQTYAQNYGALPGDDAGAGARFSSGTDSCSGASCGDGKIGTNESYNTGTATAESRLVWSHLRAANLIKNQQADGDKSVQPSNPFGGIYGVQSGSANGAFTSNILCADKVPGTAAQAIDARLDDGIMNAGAMQSIQGGAEGEENYADGQTYTICMRM